MKKTLVCSMNRNEKQGITLSTSTGNVHIGWAMFSPLSAHVCESLQKHQENCFGGHKSILQSRPTGRYGICEWWGSTVRPEKGLLPSEKAALVLIAVHHHWRVLSMGVVWWHDLCCRKSTLNVRRGVKGADCSPARRWLNPGEGEDERSKPGAEIWGGADLSACGLELLLLSSPSPNWASIEL